MSTILTHLLEFAHPCRFVRYPRFGLLFVLQYIVLSVLCFSVEARSQSPESADLRAAQAVSRLEGFLDIPYREDGAVDLKGRYTRFDAQEVFFDTPGLNCSGLLVAAGRALFSRPFTLKDATWDRLGDSGPGATLGHDWDFGKDLVLNLAGGRSPTELIPAGADHLPGRGFRISDDETLAAAIASMRPGFVYLASISKPTGRRPYRVLYYHVGLFVPDEQGSVWFYHSTPKNNVHRMQVSHPRGREWFHFQFAPSQVGEKYILIYAVTL